MAYYNTTGEKGKTLDLFAQLAEDQDEAIYKVMLKMRSAAPSQVWKATPQEYLLTSVRRSLNTLTEQGKLVKTDKKKPGPYGRPEHIWELPKTE